MFLDWILLGFWISTISLIDRDLGFSGFGFFRFFRIVGSVGFSLDVGSWFFFGFY
jgi:hypothetical protein